MLAQSPTDSTDARIEHILEDFHAPLWEELPEVEAMAHREARLHTHLEPRLEALHATIVAIRRELASHLEMEERVLFRWIRLGDPRAQGAIDLMIREHGELARLVDRARWLTDGFVSHGHHPWHALYESLALLDATLRDLSAAELTLFERVPRRAVA